MESTAIPKIDSSPLDISYYPVNYPLLNMQHKVTEPLQARVIYSRPYAKGRKIFGGLIPWNTVWRFGANEETEIEFYTNVLVNGNKVKKGRYSMFAIPDSTSWTIILNKDLDTWGSFAYDQSKDVLRTKVPVTPLAQPVENLSIFFDKAAGGYALRAMWENAAVSVPIISQ